MSRRQDYSPNGLLILLLVIWMHGSSFTQSPQGQIPSGDADGNGIVNPFDLDVILAHILNQAEAVGNADANDDGNVDIADWVRLNSFLFPADPSVLVPAVHVELSANNVPAGGPLQANWTITGIRDISGVELLLRVLEPGTVISSGDELTFTPGVIPGNGKAFYRTAGESWTDTETVFGPATTGEGAFALPSQAEGEWLVEVIARDSATATVLAVGNSRLIAGDSPTLRLFLNRPVANTNDQVVLTLQTTTGQSAQEVAITALMVLPDEGVVSLPGFNNRIKGVYEGPAREAEHLLLSRHFLESGEGKYRVEVKMFERDGGLLALANAGLEVCDITSQVSGTVREGDSNPVDGETAVAAQVRAFDIFDGRVAGTAPVMADGRFELDLQASRYLLLAVVQGEEGQLTGQEVVTVDCSGETIETDLHAGEPSGSLTLQVDRVDSIDSQRAIPEQQTQAIPNPKLFLNLDADDPDTAAIAQVYVVEWSNQFPGVDITTDTDVADWPDFR